MNQVSTTARDAEPGKGEATRQRLLRSARAAIIEGRGEMELAGVAKRAGVSPGLPYRYFESKSGLVVAVIEAFYDAFYDAVYRPAFDEVSDDWWEREKARIEKLVEFYYDEPLARFVVGRLAGDALVAEARERRVKNQVRGAVLNVRTGKRHGRVPGSVDAELAGSLLIGGVSLAIQSAIDRPRRLPRRRVVVALQRFMRDVLHIEE